MTEDKVMKQIWKRFKNEGECEIWTGSLNNGNPHITVEYQRYSVKRYIWNFNNSDNLMDLKHSCTNSCDNDLCIKPDHILKTPKKQDVNLTKIWERMLKSSKKIENGCLEWTGKLSETGYGTTSYKRSGIFTHKMSYMVKENITELDHSINDTLIRHLCSNKKCFNPEHLKLGTYAENSQDMIDAGNSTKGEKHANSKITEELAQKIKLSKLDKSDKDYKTAVERAKEFDVLPNIVYSIDAGETWSHLKDKHGKTSQDAKNKRKENAKKRAKKLKEMKWGDKEWEKAEKAILKKSVLSTVNNEFTGTPCRNWTGSTTSVDTYGTISIFGGRFFAHIISCEIKNKRQRCKEEVTRHLCSNKMCINPDHLEFGSAKENSIDTVNHSKNLKVTKEQVLEIREQYKKEKISYKKLGEIYNCSHGTIGDIIRRQTWKHI